jgi:hypothetical protein
LEKSTSYEAPHAVFSNLLSLHLSSVRNLPSDAENEVEVPYKQYREKKEEEKELTRNGEGQQDKSLHKV